MVTRSAIKGGEQPVGRPGAFASASGSRAAVTLSEAHWTVSWDFPIEITVRAPLLAPVIRRQEARGIRTMLGGCLLAGLMAPAIAGAEPAEYAIRWSEGGPRTTDAVIQRLALAGERNETIYSIQYFDFAAPPPLAPKETAIGRLRTRTKSGKTELTYKTRADLSAMRQKWVCPLQDAKLKTEVDVTVLLHGSEVRKLSRSCESKQIVSFPASLKAKAKGCINKMTRTEIGKVKIEFWTTPHGELLEVSMPGTTSDADLAAFRKMVAPLLDAGIKPLDRSKTEAGSEC